MTQYAFKDKNNTVFVISEEEKQPGCTTAHIDVIDEESTEIPFSSSELTGLYTSLYRLLGDRPISIQVEQTSDRPYTQSLSAMPLTNTSDEENGLYMYYLNGRNEKPIIYLSDWLFDFDRHGELNNPDTSRMDDEVRWFSDHEQSVLGMLDRVLTHSPWIYHIRADVE